MVIARGRRHRPSHSGIDKPGEQSRRYQTAPLRVVRSSRVGRKDVVERSALFLECRDLRPDANEHVPKFNKARPVTDRPCPGMTTVLAVVRSTLRSAARIEPSMLPPVE